MAKTLQNQVPYEFESLYTPIRTLKNILQSKTIAPDPEQVARGFVMMHFSTFLISHLHKQLTLDKSNTKYLVCREVIEEIMQEDSFTLNQEHFAKLFSFIDNLAKILNTTNKAYIYVAMYQAYLDSKIYQHLHPELGIYDFKDFQYVQPETVKRMEDYHNASIEVIKEYEKLTKSIKTSTRKFTSTTSAAI